MSRHSRARIPLALLLAAFTGCGSTVASQVPAAGTAAGGGLSGSGSDGLYTPGTGDPAQTAFGGAGSGIGGGVSDAPSATGSVSGPGGQALAPAGADPGGGLGGGPGAPASAPGAATTGPVKVGIVVVENNAAFGESLGVEGASNGDEPGNARALVKAINAAGGLAGRTIDPRYRLIRISEASKPSQQLYAEICAHFTEDDPVPVVLVTGVFDDTLWSCLTRKGVLGISQLPQYIGGKSTLGYDVIAPNAVSVPRQATLLADGLFNDGYYKGAAKVGIISTDDPIFRPVVEKQLVPALRQRGLTVSEPAFLPKVQGASDLGAVSAASGNAVLRFRSEGVDRVVFLEGSAAGALTFMRQADNQGYRPKYGMTSAQYPTTLTVNVPASQLEGAVVTSWVPSGDVTPQGAPVPPGRARCLAALKASGITYSAGTSPEVAALQQCDGLFLLADAAASVGAADLRSLRAGALRLGASWKPAVTVSGNLAPGRKDGAGSWHIARFDRSCTCFRTDPQRRPVP